jgi:tetratricopeptide (TPR) repeat protein
MRRLFGRFGGVIVAALAAVMVLLLSTPGFADAAADRAALDKLFAELKSAPDAATARGIDQQIWRIWFAPSDPELAGKMAAVLAVEQAGDLQRAMDLLGKMVADYPDYAEGWNQRATVEYQLKQYDASLADIDKVLALEPRHFGALSGRVLIYLAEGNRPQALRAMLTALAVHPFLATKALFPELSQPATHA